MKIKFNHITIMILFIVSVAIPTTNVVLANDQNNHLSYKTSLAKNNFNIQANYNIEQNIKNKSNFFYNIIINCIQKINKYKIWGETSKNFSEEDMKYHTKNQIGIRIEHNTNPNNYYYIQEEWIANKNYETNSQNTILIGNGKNYLTSNIHNFHTEFGPGIYIEKYQDENINKKLILYGSASYNYQLNKYVKFIQKISFLTKNIPILKSKSAFEVNITDDLTLKCIHAIEWNKNLLENFNKISEKKTNLALFYNINF
ncbi:MAG: acid-inducible putative outer membrane protein YdiY [Candidatus Westeberhardia cardiocondylae]|nr:acid-inducible putative outer membrane protein YdiY [Candidatus Westeberhardia cardiocondylae]